MKSQLMYHTFKTEIFFFLLNFKDVGKHQISLFLKEKKELLIQEIKTSVNVKKKELDRQVINEVSKYIEQSNTLSNDQPQSILGMPLFRIQKIENYIENKEDKLAASIKNLPVKEIISAGIVKSRNDAKKAFPMISNYEKEALVNNQTREEKMERKTLTQRTIDLNTLSKSIKRKKTTIKVLEEDIKYEDSLEINEEKRSRNERAFRERNEHKSEDPKDIQKIMRHFHSNTIKRIHSSILFKKEKTYEKELIQIKPVSNPRNIIPSKHSKPLIDKQPIEFDSVFNAVLNKYLNNQLANQTAFNIKPKYKNESTDMRSPSCQDVALNHEGVANIRYAGFGERNDSRFRNKHISPEVQLKYFKFTRKKRNQSGHV